MLYLLVKSFHVMAVIAWMAGLFYLPRLFVYHVDAQRGSAQSETFKVMERRLLNAIMNPAMLASWLLGLWLLFGFGAVNFAAEGWFHVKLALVVALTVFHMLLGSWRRAFAEDRNTRSARFYRIANEVPTLLMMGIVLMVIVRPF
ncbi:MAG: protoporphyrinogen oxidase HemJ [Pseudomonadota bacterium]|nr:protoporphyrinogen oxidase HemJ [Pseudomonadota bacterium]